MIHLARYYQPVHLDTTLGEMDVHGVTFWTVERGWHNNAVDVSCVPEGTYLLKRGVWYRGEREDVPTFEIVPVIGRSEIKIHYANESSELRGCLGIGDGVGWVHGRLAVLNTVEAHHRFMRIMQDYDEEQIRITQARGMT
jgi:hypothetical protein